MNINDIETLTYNSFFCRNLIVHFLSGCNGNQIKFELIFLLLPIVLKNESRTLLKNANSSSSLHSLFLNKPEGKISIGGLEKRLDYFRPLTQTSIIAAAGQYDLIVSDFIKLNGNVDYTKEENSLLKEFYKASFYLGKILSSNDLFDTYLKLGIKEI